jgi:enediyne biosynthesis protein E4
VGHRNNRDAIGAQIKLVSAGSLQAATVATAGSYLLSNDKRVHFGLGRETSARSIEILWPDDTLQTLANVKADQALKLDEPGSAAK